MSCGADTVQNNSKPRRIDCSGRLITSCFIAFQHGKMKLLKFHLTRQPYELIVILRSIYRGRITDSSSSGLTAVRTGKKKKIGLKWRQPVCYAEFSSFQFAVHMHMPTDKKSISMQELHIH